MIIIIVIYGFFYYFFLHLIKMFRVAAARIRNKHMRTPNSALADNNNRHRAQTSSPPYCCISSYLLCTTHTHNNIPLMYILCYIHK